MDEVLQLLATTLTPEEQARKEVFETMLDSGLKIGGVLILVVLFAWLRQRFLEQGRRLREPRVKPWERED
ncbi:MAG: hypothetical protein AAF585_16155 [Verrucomicrobiota bacterium]